MKMLSLSLSLFSLSLSLSLSLLSLSLSNPKNEMKMFTAMHKISHECKWKAIIYEYKNDGRKVP
jgi:hypothetical protein